MEQECCERFTVMMDLGLHLRPAAILVRTANGFQSDVTVSDNCATVSGKSILSLIILGAGPGAVLTVVTRGPDAREAMDAIGDLFRSSFGEPWSETKIEFERALAGCE